MPTRSPIAGECYPRDYGEFMAWFPTDDDRADYLEWLRWPFGFECPGCQSVSACRLADGRYKCTGCQKCTSVTAGTIFDRTRTPLTVWFHAAWHFATQKDGISALALQRDLALSSYQTAWAMLNRLRSVAVRPGRERLSGDVEVDETFIGGKAPGDKGGRTHGEKALVTIAVQRREPKGWGRCRMAVIPDACSALPWPALLPPVRAGRGLPPGALQGVHRGEAAQGHQAGPARHPGCPALVGEAPRRPAVATRRLMSKRRAA